MYISAAKGVYYMMFRVYFFSVLKRSHRSDQPTAHAFGAAQIFLLLWFYRSVAFFETLLHHKTGDSRWERYMFWCLM